MTIDKITIKLSTNAKMTERQLEKLNDAVGAIMDDLEGIVRVRLENEPLAQQYAVSVVASR